MKLKILGIKPAVSKADKIYWKVTTDKGSNFTAFDEDIVKAIAEAYSNKTEINLNVVPSADGKYQNIRGFALIDDEEEIYNKDGISTTKLVVKPEDVENAFMGHKSNGRTEEFGNRRKPVVGTR